MLLIRLDNAVLLQKRPSKAIWGGLWSLPESPWRPRTTVNGRSPKALKGLLEAALPDEKSSVMLQSLGDLRQGQQIKHIFTHRRLWMQIWEVQSLKSLELTSSNFKWVPLNQLGRYGLPQPIKLLLQGLSLARGDDLKK